MKSLLLAILFALMTAAALAHSKLDTTFPTDGAVLVQVPHHLRFSFARDIRLTRVRMTHADRPAVDLDLDGQNAFATRFWVPLIGGGKGRYRIEWRGVAADGHAMRGAFTFRMR